jgi:hypothetical protein
LSSYPLTRVLSIALVTLLVDCAITPLTGCGGIARSAQTNTANNGTIGVASATLNFGTVMVGSTKTMADSVSNNTSAAVSISSIQGLNSGFQVTGLTLPTSLAAGQTLPFSVQFKPTASGNPSVTISFLDANGQPLAAVSATATAETVGQLAPSLGSLIFSSTQVGNSQSLSESLTNTGSSSITISQANTTGAGFSISGLGLPMTLSANQSVTFTATFRPTSAGAASGNLTVTSTASNTSLAIPLSGTATAVGQLSASPSALNFNSVTVGSRSTLSGSLIASGTAITITSASLNNNEFSLSGISFPVTVPAGQSAPFSVTFTPGASGATSASLSFVSNASNSPAVQTMSGTGTASTQHSVGLSWNTSTGAVGYNVYRGTVSGGPYGKINSALNATAVFVDNTVVSGQTYYYVATAVDGSSNESGYSNQVQAVIPNP